MAGKTKEFLQILEKLSADGVEVDTYKDNLDDAIEGTRDAMNVRKRPKRPLHRRRCEGRISSGLQF